MAGLSEQVAVSSSEGTATVVETPHGPLKVPNHLLGLWEAHGWPEADVLAQMAAESRWRP